MEIEPFESKMPKPPEDGAILKKVYYQVTKNKEDGIETTTRHPMPIYEFPGSPEDESHFLSQASPVIINSPEIRTHRSKDKLTAMFPDSHIGFRELPNGEIQTTHNIEAIDLWLQVMEREQPERIIIQGDLVDAAPIGKFDPDSNHYADTLQTEIDGAHAIICRMRAGCPNAEIVYLRGNHSLRFQKNLIRHSLPLLGVRQANLPESFAVNTLPFLLRLEEQEIEYQEKYMVNDKLMAVHGEFSNTRGSAAAKYLGFYALSTCYAHDHRVGYEKRRFPNGTEISAFGFGCLADIKGSVPSYHSRIDDKGYVVENYENWNVGAGFIETGKNSTFKPHFVSLDSDKITYNNRIYKARQEVVKALASGK